LIGTVLVVEFFFFSQPEALGSMIGGFVLISFLGSFFM